MKKCFVFLFLFLIFFGCNESDVVIYPVEYKGNTFLSESKIRNKKRLEVEVKAIQEFLKTKNYKQTAQGVWLSNNNIKNKVGDFIQYQYRVKNLKEETLYSYDEIGIKQSIIGKDNLIRGLQTALHFVSEKDTLKAVVPSSLAYGYQGDGERIGINQPILLEIVASKIQKADSNP